jgi:hypothetical protein
VDSDIDVASLRSLTAVERSDAPDTRPYQQLVPKCRHCSKPFSRIRLRERSPGGGMAYAGDLKSIWPIWQHRAPTGRHSENS